LADDDYVDDDDEMRREVGAICGISIKSERDRERERARERGPLQVMSEFNAVITAHQLIILSNKTIVKST